MTDNEKLARVLAEHGLYNCMPAVKAFEEVGERGRVGFDLAACATLLENESMGDNLWGQDPWNEASYPKGLALDPVYNETEVTQKIYTVYKVRRNEGLQPQGCGPCQLTNASLQIAAENLGGCWIPRYNMEVGFRFLQQLFERYGSPFAAFSAYNGSGPAASAYAEKAVARQDQWRAWLRDA